MKQLFLCHHQKYADEVHELAAVLRLYGIRPWLDRQGGFSLGDSFVGEARNAIQNDCFGMIFYATPSAFERSFIRRIEIQEAIQRQEQDPNFVFITLLRDLTFTDLSTLSRQHFGVDLSLRSVYPLQAPDETHGRSLQEQFEEVASDVLARVLMLAKQATPERTVLPMQYATRESFPTDDDVLTIDATQFFAQNVDQADIWARIERGLITTKQKITAQYGRPRLRVHGSKHLTAALLFGYVFRASSGFQIEIRQREAWWATDCTSATPAPLAVAKEHGSADTSSLFVEISVTGKSVRNAVRRYIQQSDMYPFLSLRFSLLTESTAEGVIDNAACCAMARQICQEIANAVSQDDITDIHIFAAVPQALALMIGYYLNALRPVQMYEYVDGQYTASHRLS